jgi:hypothetical protein
MKNNRFNMLPVLSFPICSPGPTQRVVVPAMSKIASASEEPSLFELFRAPKIFERSSKIACQTPFPFVDDAKL